MHAFWRKTVLPAFGYCQTLPGHAEINIKPQPGYFVSGVRRNGMAIRSTVTSKPIYISTFVFT
jgi:hypothetical protein